MAKSDMFNIIIKQKTFDIVSADTGFYVYMDDSRIYYTFEKLICEADRPMFYEYVKNMYAGSFILNLTTTQGTTLPFYVSLKPGTVPGQVHLTLIDIAQWIANEKETNTTHSVQSELLELYGDDYFVFDPLTREVGIFTKRNLIREDLYLSLNDFETRLKSHSDKSKHGDISHFISELQKGTKYFELSLPGDVLWNSYEANYSLLKGSSIYTNGVRTYSVGYIHRDTKHPYEEHHQARYDTLTGVLSKPEITNLAIRAIDVEKRQNVSIAIVDVDYFKKINDTYGHMTGDNTLKKVASIMDAEVGSHGVVGRIGGDEFFILFFDAYDLEDSRSRLRSIKNIVSATFPANQENTPAITLSIGCAAYPKDADNFNDLFTLADFAVYRAKEKGRNRYIIYDEKKHGSLAEIQSAASLTTRINSREDMSLGDIMCVIMDKVYGNEPYSIEKLLDDFIENFEPERITIYNFERAKIKYMIGAQICNQAIKAETESYIHGEFFKNIETDGIVVIDDVYRLELQEHSTYEQMRSQGIRSCIHIKFWDKNGARCVLSLESLSKKITWNNDHMHYYRLLARMLSQYKIV